METINKFIKGNNLTSSYYNYVSQYDKEDHVIIMRFYTLEEVSGKESKGKMNLVTLYQYLSKGRSIARDWVVKDYMRRIEAPLDNYDILWSLYFLKSITFKEKDIIERLFIAQIILISAIGENISIFGKIYYCRNFQDVFFYTERNTLKNKKKNYSKLYGSIYKTTFKKIYRKKQ